ncbi:MAG: hypothetical protein AAF208_13695 [Cyanobacteria bacterium P01_A01_bin.45]
MSQFLAIWSANYLGIERSQKKWDKQDANKQLKNLVKRDVQKTL